MFARLIAYFFVGVLYAVGPILLIIAIGASIPTLTFVHAANPADGTIIGFDRVYMPRRSKEVYLPVFRFTANDGKTHMIMADSGVNWVEFKRGDRVPILYLKDRPESARIATIPQLWMPQLILAFFGVLLTLFSVWILMRRRSSSRVVVTI
jgi:hypothetical protein